MLFIYVQSASVAIESLFLKFCYYSLMTN